MDNTVPQEEVVNTEIIYEAYFQDNVDSVSSSQFSNANEALNGAEEQGISTSQNENNCSNLGAVTKKGRAKGSVNSKKPYCPKPKRVYKQRLYQPRPRPPKPLVFKPETEPSRLPRMGIQLTQFNLPTDKIKEYQTFQQPFLQPGVCFKIAPKLDLCIECKIFDSQKHVHVHVDCRFYHFRKLK